MMENKVAEKLGSCLVDLWLVCVVAVSVVFAGEIGENTFRTDRHGVALQGYDAVAYTKDNQPSKGNAKFQVEWKGAKWYFANEAHQQLFQDNPEAYAPQYGGFCAYAASQGAKAPVDPKVFTVYKNKLYLNLNRQIQRVWEKRKDVFIQLADRKWPSLQ